MKLSRLLLLAGAASVVVLGVLWFALSYRQSEQTVDTAAPPARDMVLNTPPADGSAPPPTGGQGAPPPEPLAPPTNGDQAEAVGEAPPPPAEPATGATRGREEAAPAEEDKSIAAAPMPLPAPEPTPIPNDDLRAADEVAPPPPPPPPPPPSLAKEREPAKAKPRPGDFGGQVMRGAAPGAAPPPTMTAAAPPVMPEEIPIFPWPLPKASAVQELPRRLIVGSTNTPTFGSVAERIASALDHAGYGERSYYALADGHGVAIATQLEQINDDGSPKLEVRFEEKLVPLAAGQFSLTSYVKALFSARTGRFRIIVFALSSGVAQSSKPPSEGVAKSWAPSGQTHLPRAYASIPFTDAVTCTAMIYEFEKKDYAADANFVQPGKVTALSHLQRAGIWALLSQK